MRWRGALTVLPALVAIAAFASYLRTPSRWWRAPVVSDFPEHGRKARDLMLGIEINHASRAYLCDGVPLRKTCEDDVGGVATGRRRDFQGCASPGVCLERVPVIKDYWDWRNYHPQTTIR